MGGTSNEKVNAGHSGKDDADFPRLLDAARKAVALGQSYIRNFMMKYRQK